MPGAIAPLIFAAALQAPAPGVAVSNSVPPVVPGSTVPSVIVVHIPPTMPVNVRPPQATRPAQSYFSPDDYPASAAGTGAQGLVRFVLTVGTDGHIILCTITRSSGSSALDEWTCNIMRRRARFRPAMDSNGAPVAGNIEQEVVWHLPRG